MKIDESRNSLPPFNQGLISVIAMLVLSWLLPGIVIGLDIFVKI
jgi:hypothetical protein